MKVKTSLAILVALFASSNALRITDDDYGYPFGSPYSSSEQKATNKEVQDAFFEADFSKGLKDYRKTKQEEQAARAQKEKEEIVDWNADATNPSHNQGKKFEIVEQNAVQLYAEPPSKPAGTTESPTIGEEEGKGKELADANNQSAQFQA